MNISNRLFFNVDLQENGDIKQALLKACTLISDIEDCLINLEDDVIQRRVPEKEDKEFGFIILLIIHKIIEYIDTIALLISHARTSQAIVLLRSLYEICLNCKFILKEDTPIRAALYYLSFRYEEEMSSGMSIKLSTINNNDMDAKIDINQEKIISECSPALKREISGSALLTNAKQCMIETFEEKSKSRNGRKLKHIEWYSFCSKAISIFDIAKELNWDKYHKVLYSLLSLEAHGLNATNFLEADEDGHYLRKLGYPVFAHILFHLTCTWALSAFSSYFIYYWENDPVKRNIGRQIYCDFTKKKNELYEELSVYARQSLF